jgi:autotransporter-associated beta strand protein
VLEASGTIARNIGNTYRQVFWTGAGGFAAFGGDLTVTLNGGQTVDWGNNPQGFNGKTLILGSATATDKVTMTNNIALKATRTVQVNDNTSTANDIAEFSGVLSDGGPVSGLTKTGTGLLILSNANAYTGVTTVSAGALVLNSANALPGGIGATGGTSNLTFNGGVIGLGVGDFTRSLDAATNAAAATFTGNGGWAAYGADRLVNLGGASAQIVWATANTGLNAKTLILGAATATNKVTLQNPLDLGNAARTVQVDDGAAAEDAELSGALSGAGGGLTKTGAGTLVLSNANTHTGATTVSAGTLKLSNPSALQNSTLTMGGGSLVFDRSVTANAFTFGGLAATAAGAGYDIALQNNDSSPAAVALTVGGNNAATTYAAVLSGTDGSLTKVGTGTLTLTGANTYTGATSASGGQITVSGASGVINQSSGITLAGGRLLLDNATNSNDRIKDAATITLSSGGELNLTGSATGTTETVGNLALAAGNSTVTVKEATAGQIATLAGAGFSRSAGATALFRGQSLGQNATQMGMVTLTDTTGLTLVGTTTLSGAASGDTTKNVTIVPYLIGGSTDTDTGSTFVTYDTALGFRALNVTNQFVTLAAAYATQTDHENVKSFNGTITAADPTVNSLLFNGAHALNGSGTLTVDSGAIALVTNNAASIATGFTGGVTLGNGAWNEGVITVTQNVLTINPAITVTGGGGLIKAGGGTLTLSGANTYTGTTTVSAGTLAYGANAVISTGAVTVNGTGAVLAMGTYSDTVGLVTLTAGDITGSGTLTSTSGFTMNNAAAASVSVALDGAVGLTKSAAGVLTLSGTNTYTGGTTVTAGALTAAKAASLPGYDSAAKVVFNGGTVGGMVGGSGWTTGQVDTLLTNATKTSGALGIDTTNGSLTQWTAFTTTNLGSALGLTKLGANTLILDQANTYAGTTTVSAGVLNIRNGAGLGSTAGGTTVASGAALELQGGITIGAEVLSLNGTGISNGGALRNVSGDNTCGGLITLAGASRINSDSGTLTLDVASGNAVTATNLALTLGGAGNITVADPIATGTGTLIKDGTGTAILAGNNTYTGLTTVSAGTLTLSGNNTGTGGTTLTAGTLNVNHAHALGNSGTITLTSGTINNTSGATITNSVANPITLNGNFTFGGANDLNLGTGAVTNAASRTITLNGTGSALTLGGVMTNGMAGDQTTTVNGPGNTLVLGGYALSNSGTSRTGTFNGTGNVTITGAVVNGSTATASALTYSGSGVLTLSGTNTYAGATTVSSGRLNVAGSINASAVTVSNAGTVLAGGGSVKSLAMNAGTIVAPGDGGVGDLGVVAGNCSLATTAVYQWELGSGGNDVVDVAGNLTLTDGWVLKLIDAGGTVSAGTQYNLFTYTGTLSLGTYTIDNSLVDWNISGATISSDATRVYITGLAESGGMAAPAIPEPATAMLLIFGAAAMLRRRRSSGVA